MAVNAVQPIPEAELAAQLAGGVHAEGHDTEFQAPFTYASKQLVVMLKISRPKAGEAIASRCDVVMQGSNSPFEVELTSSIALPFGAEPSELIPTL